MSCRLLRKWKRRDADKGWQRVLISQWKVKFIASVPDSDQAQG